MLNSPVADFADTLIYRFIQESPAVVSPTPKHSVIVDLICFGIFIKIQFLKYRKFPFIKVCMWLIMCIAQIAFTKKGTSIVLLTIPHIDEKLSDFK